MPGETITIQAGQCGNQVGTQFWSQLALEHGLLPDGTSTPYPQDQEQPEFDGQRAGTTNHREDRAELFFTLSDSGKYTPRSVLIDLEPSVIQRATNGFPMFNPRNIHLSETGDGAANNWSRGYAYGTQHVEELLEIIDRESDRCENLSTFQVIHSVAGGTGSGVGSYLLEELNDRFGAKKLITTSSIFPSSEKTSDVIVQPYNTLLTLDRLIDCSDWTTVFDNDSLNKIQNDVFGLSQTSDLQFENSNNAFNTTNKLISYVIASISNPIRFPGYMYTSYESILSSLIPVPELKFLSASIAPFADLSAFHSGSSKPHLSNMNEYDLILELLDDKYKMNKIGTTKPKYISMFTYLIGSDLNQDEIRKGKLKALKRLEFVPWTPSSISVVNGKKSPFMYGTHTSKHKNLNGLSISNNTSMVPFLIKILQQYDALAKRGAFINSYIDADTVGDKNSERERVLDNFNQCKEHVLSVIDEYKACQAMEFLEDDLLEVDEMM
ncbi:gamma-tubulin [Yamadazyma tenuis]|uniref:Tubulin gamma chain n=1 Tax=Candida tenuis (strain ATCC 10573 / BCRC 21748 / CBS 615 / JCM 9827 / NBRC 10315 / NRRL Y-1498 / VKM Y-70) TaxID=590646 RepID=G3B2R3_CANTC|nr:tubulin nucleotide-binding domain-like protein [Yamadazyma tenuis ATCC 10573]EGV64739.1 tubulin nucleotide-binding domain-like protein [Yamadazyma tenuis ATCC 10573]WEJ97531.1 gamma-tubulin [Yamadazyma tenuis]